jgi:hypothetical protein
VPWSFVGEAGRVGVDPLKDVSRFWVGVGGGSHLVGCSMSRGAGVDAGCSDSVRAAKALRSLMYRCIVGNRSLL